GEEIAGHAAIHCATHHDERALERGADLLHGTPLILRFRLERELRERHALLLGVANGVGEGAIHQALTLSRRNAQRTHGSARISSRTPSPGMSSTSITMNASPPRCFRVSRRFAMLISCSARIVAMAATEPFTSSAMSTMV